jgi:hypothetical protein
MARTGPDLGIRSVPAHVSAARAGSREGRSPSEKRSASGAPQRPLTPPEGRRHLARGAGFGHGLKGYVHG